ncbi:MAG: sigma-70 family RNA polymerase sigma factor [Candidatus Omnitrophica bacterium]|nr:sigma-70 family RNA polymerase sigma factor [Candidatus Omnitrophota bacterium]
MRDPDDELIRLSQQGSKTAFGKLVDRYYEMVFVLAFGILHHHEGARDVTQDVFLKVFREIKNFKGESKFKTWLYRVAVNAAIDALRKQRPHEHLDGTDVSDEDEKPPLIVLDRRAGPREKASESEMRALVREALDKLSPDHRAALVLREWHELSYEEMAHALGIELGTVMSRLHYARKKLSEILSLRLMEY